MIRIFPTTVLLSGQMVARDISREVASHPEFCNQSQLSLGGICFQVHSAGEDLRHSKRARFPGGSAENAKVFGLVES